MGQYNETGHRSFLVDAAYPRRTRMKLSGTYNTLTVAGASDACIGTLFAASQAGPPTDMGTVHLRNAQGTTEMIAAGAIAANAQVFAAANGQVAATGTVIEGYALQAATAAGDLIEVMHATR